MTVPSLSLMVQLMSKMRLMSELVSCHDAAHVKDQQFHIRSGYSYNIHRDGCRLQIMNEHEKHIHSLVVDFLMLPFLLTLFPSHPGDKFMVFEDISTLQG